MDNTAKYLLVSAAVLIGIILIAYTIKIVSDDGNSSSSGTMLSSALSSKAQKGNKQLVALFDDITSSNLVDIPDRKLVPLSHRIL